MHRRAGYVLPRWLAARGSEASRSSNTCGHPLTAGPRRSEGSAWDGVKDPHGQSPVAFAWSVATAAPSLVCAHYPASGGLCAAEDIDLIQLIVARDQPHRWTAQSARVTLRPAMTRRIKVVTEGSQYRCVTRCPDPQLWPPGTCLPGGGAGGTRGRTLNVPQG